MRFGPLCSLGIRGFRPIIGSAAAFALLVTTSCTLLSFLLCCHLYCCFHCFYCFPHLDSKRAKQIVLLPCLQGLSYRHLFANELVPIAGSRVGVIGFSKKLLLLFLVSIIKTIERRVRWTGKKLILSCHRSANLH